jgi:hypothetical protein
MDGLKLRMGDGGLSNRGKIVAARELAKINHQVFHDFWRRRDEGG